MRICRIDFQHAFPSAGHYRCGRTWIEDDNLEATLGEPCGSRKPRGRGPQLIKTTWPRNGNMNFVHSFGSGKRDIDDYLRMAVDGNRQSLAIAPGRFLT